MNNENDWKKKNKFPACTQPPWSKFIPIKNKEDTIRKIKRETIDNYGYSMEECPKRLKCNEGTKCLGRELPWKSKTAKPYLDKLAETQKIVNGELFVRGCKACEIRNKCTKVCIEVNDYINRGKNKEPKLIYKNTVENFNKNEGELSEGINKLLNIPWDILPNRKQKIIDLYVYKGRDFKHISEILDLNNQARVKYEFYSALTKLSEYATMREFLKNNKSKLNENQTKILNEIYINNNTITNVSSNIGISKQAVQQTLARIIRANKIKWEKFVRKRGNRIIYSTLRIWK